MQRVVVLGRGGAGKSTASARLGRITGLPVVELDGHFWRRDLTPTPRLEWIETQRQLAAAPRWIMDGDLGPYDSVGARLEAADTVLVLDFSRAVRVACNASIPGARRFLVVAGCLAPSQPAGAAGGHRRTCSRS